MTGNALIFVQTSFPWEQKFSTNKFDFSEYTMSRFFCALGCFGGGMKPLDQNGFFEPLMSPKSTLLQKVTFLARYRGIFLMSKR